MKLYSVESPLLNTKVYLEESEGIYFEYDLDKIKLSKDYIDKNKVSIDIERTGVDVKNQDYAKIEIVNPPKISNSDWRKEFILTMKQDLLFKNIVKKEYIGKIFDAL